MDKNFCFIVFSHTGNREKEEILTRCLTGLKEVGIPIIVASHLPISENNQDLCDYFLKDTDNLIITEADVFSNPVQIESPLYYVHDYFGGKIFSTHLFKKSYQPGVFNLYINSFNLAKRLGFKNVILWEFDFSIGPESKKFLLETMDLFQNNNLDFYGFESFIQELPCIHAIPSFLNIEALTSILPNRPIQDPSDYSSISKMMIMEQWTHYHIWKDSWRRGSMDYGFIDRLMSDLTKGEVHSQRDNHLFFGLRSGLYFNREERQIIFYGSNGSGSNLKTQLLITDPRTGELLVNTQRNIPSSHWFYDGLSQKIWDLAQSDSGILVSEILTNVDSGESDEFKYPVSSRNFDFMTALKKWKSDQ
jgi:hypothetical protein